MLTPALGRSHVAGGVLGTPGEAQVAPVLGVGSARWACSRGSRVRQDLGVVLRGISHMSTWHPVQGRSTLACPARCPTRVWHPNSKATCHGATWAQERWLCGQSVPALGAPALGLHISSSLLNTLLFGAALEELGDKRGASLSGEQRDPSPGGSVTFVSAANALWGCRTHAN